MFPILQVGPLAIQLPGLFILLGLWLGITLAEKNSPRYGIPSHHIGELVVLSSVAGIVGARLVYVLRYPQVFAESPLSILSINPSLLDPLGGAVCALIAAAVVIQHRQLASPAVLDSLVPFFASSYLGLGFSQLASGAAFGAPTTLPWGIWLWGASRHPTQIYTVVCAALILYFFRPGNTTAAGKAPGLSFLTFAAYTAGSVILIEGFRGNSLLLPGGFRLLQVIAWLVMAACLWGMGKLQPQAVPIGKDEETEWLTPKEND